MAKLTEYEIERTVVDKGYKLKKIERKKDKKNRITERSRKWRNLQNKLRKNKE